MMTWVGGGYKIVEMLMTSYWNGPLWISTLFFWKKLFCFFWKTNIFLGNCFRKNFKKNLTTFLWAEKFWKFWKKFFEKHFFVKKRKIFFFKKTKCFFIGVRKNFFHSYEQPLCFFEKNYFAFFEKQMFFWEIVFEKISKNIWQLFCGRKSFGNFEKKFFEKQFPQKTFFFQKNKVLVHRGKKVFFSTKNFFL